MRIHDKTTALRMAACHALGLHYWSGHPQQGCVWAVDDYQQAHVVRVYARDGLAHKVATFVSGHLLDRRDSDAVPFTVSEDTQYLFATNQPTNQEEFSYV